MGMNWVKNVTISLFFQGACITSFFFKKCVATKETLVVVMDSGFIHMCNNSCIVCFCLCVNNFLYISFCVQYHVCLAVVT